MENEMASEWSVVATRKEKRSSPKAQNRKGIKRTDLQRSTSSNQISSRRKTTAGAETEEDGARPATRSMKMKQRSDKTEMPPTGGEKSTVVQEALATIIEDVSTKIQQLSIQKNSDRSQVLEDVRKDVSFVETVGHGLPVPNKASFSAQAFCDLCRTFPVNDSGQSRQQSFQTRALINTGSACFWNCVMQALFAVEVFQRLLAGMLQRVRAEGAQLDERMPCWQEVLQLAEEFYVPSAAESTSSASGSASSASSASAHVEDSSHLVRGTPVKDGKQRVAASAEKGEKGERANPVRSPARKMAIAATALMPSLYQTFQCKMDGISGTSRTSTSTTVGGNGASKSGGGKKNNQQDAVECLTFLLDALHEEIIHTEAENARLAAEALAAGVNPRNASGKGSSPPLIEGLAKMSTDDFDLIPLDSRQNSLEMVIALTRQNSLSTEQKVGADTDANAAGDDDGWNTVTKSGKQKAKAVVVDAASKERADSASSASVISRLFHATLRSEVLYQAKKTNSVTFQRFHCLTLDVGVGGITGTISLDTCLANYFAMESIDEGKVKKQLKLDSLPEALILQLARFSFDYNKFIPIKILKSVEYPANLCLPSTIFSDELRSREPGAVRYQLQSVVLHHGKKATGGHYSAFTLDVQRHQPVNAEAEAESSAVSSHRGRSSAALRDTHTWRSVNDAKVGVVSESQVLGAQDTAYILFYGRVRE